MCSTKNFEGERRELNPRIPESQPGALTTWLRSPTFIYIKSITQI